MKPYDTASSQIRPRMCSDLHRWSHEALAFIRDRAAQNNPIYIGP